MTYRAVLLDIDGTLADSNDAHALAWVQVLAESGRRVPFERVRPLIGKGGDKVLPELTGLDDESPEGRAIVDRRREIFQSVHLPHVKPTRGAAELVAWLGDEALKVVVATSAGADEVKGLLEAAGVSDLIDASSSSDDAERSKPDPDIIVAALQQADCRPDQAVMIADTPYDIEAGTRAGVGVIALRCGGWWSDRALAGALAIYDDPADLLARFGESPFVRAPRPLSA